MVVITSTFTVCVYRAGLRMSYPPRPPLGLAPMPGGMIPQPFGYAPMGKFYPSPSYALL